MRNLTFPGFLAQYVTELSQGNTSAVYPLVREAASTNARLREPLYLYAAANGRLKTLLTAARNTGLYGEYAAMSAAYPYDTLVDLLEQQAEELPTGYQKVWDSYRSRAALPQREERVKTMMRDRVVTMQVEKQVSTYRIAKDLGLNNSNLNSWLKHGTGGKVSLATARRVLHYMEQA
jgi:hypothetical protein